MSRLQFETAIELPPRRRGDQLQIPSLAGLMLLQLEKALLDLDHPDLAEKSILMDTPAFCCLKDFTAVELVKNAYDSGSTKITFGFSIDVRSNQINFHFSDNGDARRLTAKSPYVWQAALVEKSEKRGEKEKDGGNHLGLCITAHYLEKQYGTIHLRRNSREEGARVEVHSPILQAQRSRVIDPDASYKRTMQRDFLDAHRAGSPITQRYTTVSAEELQAEWGHLVASDKVFDSDDEFELCMLGDGAGDNESEETPDYVNFASPPGLKASSPRGVSPSSFFGGQPPANAREALVREIVLDAIGWGKTEEEPFSPLLR